MITDLINNRAVSLIGLLDNRAINLIGLITNFIRNLLKGNITYGPSYKLLFLLSYPKSSFHTPCLV